MSRETVEWRGYTITWDPPPIPGWRGHQWKYCHDEYDGAPDAFDRRHGTAKSVEQAKGEID